MTAGSAGALAAATPTEFALHYMHWRTLFVGLALLTFAVAVGIWLRVPDMARPVAEPGLALQWAGVRSLFSHPRFWWIAPLAGCCTGSFFAVQGLWSVPWLTEVNGFDRGAAAGHLFWMGMVMFAGYLALGLFAARLARHGVGPRHLFALGFALNIVALAAIVGQLPGTYVWWALYGLGAAANVLAFATLNVGFAAEFAGRANTALNLLMFGGGFVVQWGIGLVVDAARAGLGLDAAERTPVRVRARAGLRRADLCVVRVGLAAARAVFVRGSRRAAVRTVALVTARRTRTRTEQRPPCISISSASAAPSWAASRRSRFAPAIR